MSEIRLIDANKILNCNCKGTFSECDTCLDSELCALLNDVPTVLEIPDNPTNGDMQQAILPKHWEWGTNGDFVHVWGDGQSITFTLEWWNAPYKGTEHE